jgi:hypothetical protein
MRKLLLVLLTFASLAAAFDVTTAAARPKHVGPCAYGCTTKLPTHPHPF